MIRYIVIDEFGQCRGYTNDLYLLAALLEFCDWQGMKVTVKKEHVNE